MTVAPRWVVVAGMVLDVPGVNWKNDPSLMMVRPRPLHI